MNKSNLMKAAHKIAKETAAIVGDYLIALKLALKTVWKSEENKMKVSPIELNERKNGIASLNGVLVDGVDYSKMGGTEKQVAWAKDKIATAFSNLIKDQLKSKGAFVDAEVLDNGFAAINKFIAENNIGKKIEESHAKQWIEGNAYQMINDFFVVIK